MGFSINDLVNELEGSFKGAGKTLEDAVSKIATTKLDENTRNEMFKTICGIIPGKVSNDTVLSAFEVMRKQQHILKKDFSTHKAGNDSVFKTKHETTVKNNKGFVEDQNNYADMAYGESTMRYSGCEVFATYNALNALKRTQGLSLADMIADYEKDGMVMGGKFGTSPQAIYDFFKKKGGIVVFVLVLLSSLLLTKEYLPMYKDALLFVEEIPSEKEVEINEQIVLDPVVFVSGDSVDMNHLGTGFVQGLTLNSLQNIKLVLEKENATDSYLDLTNKISHSVIFNIESKYSYTSGYNVSNDTMQEKMITELKENKPRLILFSPYIRFDEAPVSLRSYVLYHEILKMGYKPYVYEDVIYLLDGESSFELAQDGSRIFGLLNHRTEMGMLPYLWGNAFATYDAQLVENEADMDNVNGTITDFVAIDVKKDDIQSESFSLRFKSAVDGENYTFLVRTGLEKEKSLVTRVEADGCEYVRYLIPTGSSPFFTSSENISLQIEGLTTYKATCYQMDR